MTKKTQDKYTCWCGGLEQGPQRPSIDRQVSHAMAIICINLGMQLQDDSLNADLLLVIATLFYEMKNKIFSKWCLCALNNICNTGWEGY